VPSESIGISSSVEPAPAGAQLTQPPAGPTHVGPYRIVRVLGEGGMGVVYLAEQDEPVRRQVALKVLRHGLNTNEVVARFHSEQQTLAMMEHPNITRVYDAGVTEGGLPYFVMEYVVGHTITEYAATHRLSIRERINVFIQVCRAVQHAHQKGIIHRDIKPSNVIVTDSDGDPLCKVIDFGIAKAVAPSLGSERLTMTGMALGTPAYMSPEQFLSDGTDIDTRADIYALGAMLYELLAGVLPFDPAKYSGMAALLAQHVTNDPPPPSVQFGGLPVERRAMLAAERRTDASTLRHVLAGDLDAVILDALERDRERRYATANAFALDLENYLANKPVSAHTSSVAYRAGKFTRRHRVGVTFTATVLILLAAAAIGATVQARRLARARAVAVARQGQAEDLIGFMLGDLRDKLTVMGRLDVLDSVGAKALVYFAAVPASQLSDEESFRRAQALQQLGEVRMAQGKLPDAARLMGQSLAISKRLALRDSLNGKWQIGLAHSHFWAGNVDWELGSVDSALDHFVPFVTISRRLIAHYPDSLEYRAELAYALNNIGFAKEANGDIHGALSSYIASLGINQSLVDRDPKKLDWQVSLAAEHNAAAVAQRKLGDFSGALASHDSELVIKESLLRHDSSNVEYQHYVGIAHAYRSELRMLTGDEKGALEDAAATRSLYAGIVAHDTTNASMQWSLAKTNRQIAQIYLEERDPRAALTELSAGQALIRRLLLKNSANPHASAERILSGIVEVQALLASGRATDALLVSQRTASEADSAVAATPSDIEHRRAAAESSIALGEVQARAGHSAGARAAWSHALALIDSTANVTQETELLAVQASALLELRRENAAAPIVTELNRRGYRRPSFLRLVRQHQRPAA
jgi:eukaryotic-like serine/threonine-protein kinase